MITIEQNVPLPKHPKKSSAWEIYKDYIDIMEIGHSFSYHRTDDHDVYFACNVSTFESDGQKRFVTYQETPHISRVWRTA